MTGKQRIQKQNHPKMGSVIKVEPITSLKDIQTIKRLLADKPMDYALFIIGINTNLRASDILSIKVEQVKDLKEGDTLDLREKKTKNDRKITLNKAVIAAIQALLKEKEYKPGDFLFTGQRGPWTVPYVSQKVKGWCKAVNLKGNYGSHSLRKTWGYHQRMTHNQSLPQLMKCFGHSTERQTLDYLCIQPEEIERIYLNEL
ncbi:MAG: integrase [Desulfobacteraceae bacterium]|jgi:integrase|nr:MAG: integrase [Desulfobacteraceae bacterium]